MSSQIQLADLTERYAFCDPAGKSKEAVKRIRSRAAIVVVGVEQELYRLFVLYAWAARATADQLVDKIFEVNEKWRPRTFGIEANAMQQLFAFGIQREARFKQVHIPILPVPQPTNVDKEYRIRTRLQPIVRDGRLFVGSTMHELITELRGFPTGETWDMIDALASCVTLIPSRPQREIRREEDDAVLRYLRASGAPPRVIEERSEQLKRLAIGDPARGLRVSGTGTGAGSA